MRLVFIGIYLCLAACTVTRNKLKVNPAQLESGKKYVFNNKHYKLDSAAFRTDNFNLDRKDISLTGLFRIQHVYPSSVSIQIDHNDTLRIFISDTPTKVFTFKVKRKGQYYEYFAEKKIVEIPPIVSFFYGKRRLDRLRLALTEKQELLIQNKYVDHNNILFLGGGGEYRQTFFYKPVLTE